MGQSDSTLEIDYQYDLPDVQRCQNLWISVILLQIHDAFHTSKHPQIVSNREAAHAWLTSNSKDFREVCDNAGFNPAKVLQAYKQLLNSPQDTHALLNNLSAPLFSNYIAAIPRTAPLQSRRGPKPKTIHDYVNGKLIDD